MVSHGYNQTPYGYHGKCEDVYGDTKWYVIHAEANAIFKLDARFPKFFNHSIIYITHFPCKECSKLIYLSNIKRVCYLYPKEGVKETINFFKKVHISINSISILS
ncbi:cytidine/deoxycytidylate deaminase family protein [Blattabacterium cuenoti]|uniref:deaminase n=1 Tax=Blattabacterium cuenoti TaxID=1653831 RepID=UPI00293C081D|nr:deaminase [Blattabacterium cuenoti]